MSLKVSNEKKRENNDISVLYFFQITQSAVHKLDLFLMNFVIFAFSFSNL